MFGAEFKNTPIIVVLSLRTWPADREGGKGEEMKARWGNSSESYEATRKCKTSNLSPLSIPHLLPTHSSTHPSIHPPTHPSNQQLLIEHLLCARHSVWEKKKHGIAVMVFTFYGGAREFYTRLQ